MPPRLVGRLIAALLASDLVYVWTYHDVQRQFDTGDAVCEGIGFGCTLGPGRQAGLWAGAVLVVGLILALVTPGLARSRRRPPRLPHVPVIVILALAAVSGCGGSEQPDEAARRLDLLVALPIDEIRPPGAVLVREGTDPGAPGDGFLEDSVAISVSRSYRFDGDATSACEGVEEQLRDQGWDIRTACRSDSQGFRQIIVGFGVACQGLPVTGRFSFNERLPDLPDEENSYLWVSVPYPGSGGTRLPPPPEGDGLSMCDDDEPHR